MAYFAITVAQRVPTRRLAHNADRNINPRGVYEYQAGSEEQALLAFHREVPIGHPDDFNIVVTRITPPRS